MRLGYQADILRYVDNTELDTVHHQALADARVDFAFGVGLRLTDRFLITDEFAGFPVPELTERVERWENTLDAGGEYTLRERFTFDANFRWFMVDYKDDPEFDQFDRDDYTISGTVFYRVFPKTSVLGELDYNMVRYDIQSVAADRDSDAWRFLVGIKGDLTAKTTALIKVGWEWRDYENSGREDWDGLIAEGSVVWKYREPSEVTSLRRPGQRRVAGRGRELLHHQLCGDRGPALPQRAADPARPRIGRCQRLLGGRDVRRFARAEGHVLRGGGGPPVPDATVAGIRARLRFPLQ